jgi:hypothetical protein
MFNYVMEAKNVTKTSNKLMLKIPMFKTILSNVGRTSVTQEHYLILYNQINQLSQKF